jgi:hypothetical protein
MTNNRGTRLMRIPIQFHIGSFKLNWRIVRDGDITLFAGCCSVGAATYMPSGDGWELVRQYLSVNPKDERSVLEFLVVHGQFEPPEGSITSKPVKMAEPRTYSILSGEREQSLHVDEEMDQELVLESLSLQEFAMIQDYVRRILVTGNPTLPTPWKAKGIQRYEIAFAGRDDSHAHVSVRHTFPSILATIQFKLAQGAKFRTCARKDCRLPFEVTSRHTRRFCTQYCAHITSLRRRRKERHKTMKSKQG